MTFNDHFALKSVLVSASNGLACSGFQTKLFGNLQSCVCTVSSKNVAQGVTHVSGDISFMGLFTGVGASNRRMPRNAFTVLTVVTLMPSKYVMYNNIYVGT